MCLKIVYSLLNIYYWVSLIKGKYLQYYNKTSLLLLSFYSHRREIETLTLCCLNWGLVSCTGVATRTQQLLLSEIPDVTPGSNSPSKPSFTLHALLLTSNRQPFLQGPSPSHACLGHYSICWFWPPPWIWHICSPWWHQSCTAALGLLPTSSRRTH